MGEYLAGASYASASVDAVSDLRGRPWRYPYRDDPDGVTRLGRPILRPFVPITLSHAASSTSRLNGLVDTGADAILASDLLAEDLCVDLTDHEGEIDHLIGGRRLAARYKTVALRIHHHRADLAVFREWQAQVGFVAGWHDASFAVLGNVGFLDHWTVTASRFAQTVAVEVREAFDERFGVLVKN